MMDIKELKEINDRVNLLINVDKMIIEKISNIKNIIFKGLFSNIYDTIVKNVEINKESLYSIYDFQDCEDGKELIFNNIKLIDDLGLTEYINFDDLNFSFRLINDAINTKLVDELNITDDIYLDNYFNYDLEMFINDIVNDNINYDVLDYFNQVLDFYMKLNNCIDNIKLIYKIE